MAQIAIAASQTDADSPLDQTLMDALRLNEADHETRIVSLEAGRGIHEAILTDFAVEALDTDDWNSGSAGTGTITLGLPGGNDSIVNVASGGVGAGAFANISATTKRGRVNGNRDQSFVIEWRFKETGSAPGDFLLGLQDATLGDVFGTVTTVANMVGFVKGTNAGTVKFRISNAGTNTVSDNLGNRANYSVYQIAAVRSTTWSVAVTVDGTPISGSPFTSNFPASVNMRPYFGVSGAGGAGATTEVIDYVYAYWLGRPAAV